MKKLVIFFLIVNLFSYVYKIEKGWNLIGIHSNFDVKDLGDSYKLLWLYKKGKWYFYSPKPDLLASGKAKFDILKELNNTDAVWILSKNNFSIVGDFIEENKIIYNKGWQLIALPKEGNISIKSFNLKDIQYIWKFKDNKWYGYSANDKINKLIAQKFNLLDYIKDDEGFWLKANKKGEISLKNNYYAYFYFVDENKIFPLKYQLVKDKFNKFIGYTDSNGKIILSSPKTLKLDNVYNYLPIVMDFGKTNYISFVTKKEENKSEIYSKVFDIGNFREGDTLTYIEEKIPPKIFLSLDKKYGLIIKKFTSNSDITLSVLPQKENNNSILGAMKINLEDSLGNEISQQEVGFNGEFKIYFKTKKQDSDLIIMRKDDNGITYVSDTYYLNGKYYSKKILHKLGEFLFVKVPKLYSHKLYFTNVNKAIVIDSNFNSYVFNKVGKFKTLNKEENITIFADDFKSLKIKVGEEKNITLKPKQYIHKCIVIKNLLTQKTLKNLALNAKYKEGVIKLQTDNKGMSCFTIENNLSTLQINDFNYTIVNNTIYYLPEYLSLKTNALSYSDLYDYNFTYFVYNTTASSFLYDLDHNKTFKLGNYVFNSINQNIIGDIQGNIYSIVNNEVKKTNFSKEDFFEDIGCFIFSPIKSNDYAFFPTTNAKIIITSLNGDNIGISPIFLKTYDNNKSNDSVYLYDINDTFAYAIVNEGLVYLINKNTKKYKLLKKTKPLNYYKVAYEDNNLYIASDKVYKIRDDNISVYMDSKANRIFKKGNYLIADNKVFYNKKYIYSIKGKVIKTFLINKNLIIITENSIYKNDKKLISFNKKLINSSLHNGYILLEFDNGTIFIARGLL